MAILIDGVILAFANWTILLPITAATRHNYVTSNSTHMVAGTVVASLAVTYAVAWAIGAIYYAAFNGSQRGQTLGKMALGIAVRDARTGGPIGFGRALGRYLMTIVFTLALVVPFVIDSLAPLWDRRRQAWHDKVVQSVVVDLRP